VDALNPVRNDKALAHPNPLLDEPEVMLAIKCDLHNAPLPGQTVELR
jgi:hypothetical protein